jgi:hypothetical protein
MFLHVQGEIISRILYICKKDNSGMSVFIEHVEDVNSRVREINVLTNLYRLN